MKTLYPLKFSPILKDKIWGGSRLKEVLRKPTTSDKCGESWEISGVKGDVSVVGNGFLAGNTLEELIEVYMSDLVGDKIFGKFGTEFPLLIKFIDANDDLSIQVHPDDELASKRHQSFGKTEMWYIVDAEKDAELIVGFNKKLDKEEYLKNLNNKTILDILNKEAVKKGDVFFMPAGRVHAIGAGILVAEIQQTSDVTYRIYDFDRVDDKGNERELHTDLALDAIDYTHHTDYRSHYNPQENTAAEIVSCPYFTTRILHADKPVERDFGPVDSFVIYMCVEGSAVIDTGTVPETINTGETVLVPAMFKEINIKPTNGQPAKLLEVFVP